jgi:pyruvate ferredoxin oxidoreductase beta subunit
MEGLDEMKDSEQIGGRFVQREYVTPQAQEVIDRLKAEKKERKLAAKAKAKKVAVAVA